MPICLMENANMEEWDRVVDVNCKGVLHGIGCCLPIMKKQNGGHIINISSDGGLRVNACWATDLLAVRLHHRVLRHEVLRGGSGAGSAA